MIINVSLHSQHMYDDRKRDIWLLNFIPLVAAYFSAVPVVEDTKWFGFLLPEQSTDGRLSHLLRHGDSNLAGDFEKFQLHLG